MSEDKVPPKWFDKQGPEEQGQGDFKRRREKFLEELPALMQRRKERGRADSCYPYLLIRSLLGDRGDRPFNACFWESPDIWTAAGDPSASPVAPADHGGQVTAAQPNTVYAHVWNLGFAPLAGIFVEFYWFNPSLGIDGTHGNLIGIARCELAGRGMPGSHKLVKCPKPWIPVVDNGGHECLVVRASGIGDPLGANSWAPWQNRHVAQRNISVISAGANISPLLSMLNTSRPFNTRVQLIQLGPREGELARHIASPKLRLVNVETQILGEMNISNEVVSPRTLERAPAGLLAPVHPMAAGGPPPPPALREPAKVAIVDPQMLLGQAAPARGTGPHLSDLFTRAAALHAGAAIHAKPAAEEAHVVRLAAYSGDQLVGGYTMVVAGR